MSDKPKKYFRQILQKSAHTIKQDTAIYIPHWVPFAVVIFTALLYSRAIFNDFTYWDDDVYILKNPYLRDFSIKGVIAIFSKFNNGNYHPIATVTNLFEYRIWGLDPLPYHLVNVLLHMLNTWLVFRLTERLSSKRITALVVCILFAIHPLHVESVAWLSERKDVLYTSFYLLSLLAYLRYLSSGLSKKQYLYTLLFFIASCFSKSAAITLPVLLIVIDIYVDRKIDARSIFEKTPFFLLSILFGILAILAQKVSGGIHLLSDSFSFVNRAFLFTSRVAFYVLESIAPFRLSSLNCLPDINDNILPWYYYCSLPFLLALAWLIARKNTNRKEVIFGFAFFLTSISVMLQIINVGYAITAERYTYIPYIGLFYIIGQWISTIFSKHRNYVIGIFSLFTIIFFAQSWVRIGVWKNTDALFNDMVEKNPGNPCNCDAYNARGDFNNDEGNLQLAVQDYTNAIVLNPVYVEEYYKRGLIYYKLGNVQNALNDFNKTVQLDPKQGKNYNNRGLAYYELGNKKAAMLDYNQAIKISPLFAETYNNRGCAYYDIGVFDSALMDFGEAVKLDSAFSNPYYNRAAIKVKTGNLKGAVEDYTNIIKFHPTDSLAYFTRGSILIFLNDSAKACADWKKSMELGYKEATGKLLQYCH